jgi:hypothetical protein
MYLNNLDSMKKRETYDIIVSFFKVALRQLAEDVRLKGTPWLVEGKLYWHTFRINTPNSPITTLTIYNDPSNNPKAERIGNAVYSLYITTQLNGCAFNVLEDGSVVLTVDQGIAPITITEDTLFEPIPHLHPLSGKDITPFTFLSGFVDSGDMARLFDSIQNAPSPTLE